MSQNIWTQNYEVSPELAVEIIRSKSYEKIESDEENLDSIGIKIIRKFFSDKANNPDRVSKKDYLDNPFLDKYQKKSYSYFIKLLKKSDVRKREYTLTVEDSLLVSENTAKGRRGLWNFRVVDSTVAPNPYYRFYSFSIKSTSDHYPISKWVAKGFKPPISRSMRANSIPKLYALIYDPVFTVGIPKVHLITKNNNQIELPFILLGRDFISYPSNKLLLDNVLKSSGYCDSTSLSLLVYLDAFSDYGPKEFHPTPCQDLNLFKNKTCYQFASGNGTKYIATINKSYKISYAFVEEPENLLSHVKSVFETRHNESYSEITFESKLGRRFIYEIETRPNRLTHQSKKYKAIYNRGKITFNLIK